MNRSDLITPVPLYIEVGHNSLKALNGGADWEQPLDRLENGRLSDACKERLVLNLQTFLNRQSWQPRLRAFCAISARGVSLRRLTLPSAAKAELPQLLRLQIESEFPLSPDDLAWGYRLLDQREQPERPAPGHQQFLVAAVRKEVLKEYSDVLNRCGVSPLFTLAALARTWVYPDSSQPCAALDIGRDQSELISFEHGIPTSVRILSWGGENVTRAIQEKLGISREEAEKQKVNLDLDTAFSGKLAQITRDAIHPAVEALAISVKENCTARKVYLTGRSCRYPDLARQLTASLGNGFECESMEPMSAEGASAAIVGLKKSTDKNAGRPLLLLQVKEAKIELNMADPALRKWAVIAAAFLVGCVLLPYLEALLLKSPLSKKLSEANAARGRLSLINRELSFLQYFKANQPPYLDAMFLMANAAPQGTRIDSLSMNRRGEVALRGSLRDSQQVVQFRSKLIESGFFSAVVVEEQTPTPDRQKLTVRMSAQWKPAGARANLKIGPTPAEIEKIKAAAKEIGSGPPMMNFAPPPGFGTPPPSREIPLPSQGPRTPPAAQSGTNIPAPVTPVPPVTPPANKD